MRPSSGPARPPSRARSSILASGPESTRPVAEPVFDAVGGRTIWLGEAGAASAAKVMLNSWVLGIVGALSDTMALGRASGVDPQVFFDAIDGGALDLPYARMQGCSDGRASHSTMSRSRSRSPARTRTWWWRPRVDAGIRLPAMEGTMSGWRERRAAGHGDADMAAMFLATPDHKEMQR